MGGFVQRLLLIGAGWFFWRWWKNPSRSKDSKKPYIDWTDERKFQWFLNRRTGYSTGARESYSRYDQTIAGFSAGTIVLSITFLKEIGYTAWSIPFLYLAWVAFLIAVWYGLLSLRTSGEHDLEQISQLENLCMDRKRDMRRTQELGRDITKYNKIAVRSFMAGIVLAVVFAFVNFPLLGGKKWQAEKEAQRAAPQKLEVVLVAPAPKEESAPKLPQVPAPARLSSATATVPPATTQPAVTQVNPFRRQTESLRKESEEPMATERPPAPDRPTPAPDRPTTPPSQPPTDPFGDRSIQTPPPDRGYPGEPINPPGGGRDRR